MKICALVVLAGCGFNGVPGSGKAGSEVRQVAAFSAIALAGAIDADITIGADPHLEISGDDNLLPLITTEVAGNDLKIGSTRNVQPKLPLVAHITAPRLGAVRLIGSGTITLHGIHADDLDLAVTGSGTIRGDGAVHQLTVEIAGSGDLELDGLGAERAGVVISGSGDAKLTASKSLDVTINGSGTVVYGGNPEVKQHINGSGRLVKK